MIPLKNITAAILAGGTSSRMGTNKALLTLGDTTFIERIAASVQNVFGHAIIIANQTGDYAFLHRPIFSDVFPRCGPLGGLHSALVHSSTSHVFVTSCDLPFITSEMISSLVEQSTQGAITLVSDGKHTHPLFGIYPQTLHVHVERALRSGQRRMFAFLEGRPLHVLDFSPFKHNLRNINTRKDLDEVWRARKDDPP